MKSTNKTPQLLTENAAKSVTGAGFIKLPVEFEDKPKLIPPRNFTTALGEHGGDFPEESIW